MTTKAETKANVISSAASTVRVWLEPHRVPSYIVISIVIVATLGMGWVAHNAHITQQAGDIAAIIGLTITWTKGLGWLLRMIASQ